MIIDSLLCLFAYLTGSLSSAIILCRLAGLPDPREQGSGNPGATNVLRFGGKKLAATVLLGDVLKGVIPVVFGVTLDASVTVIALIGLAAFLGHLYPVFFGFRGGKGVATALGVMFGFDWRIALLVISVWILVSLVFRLSSLAALSAAAAAPFISWLLHADDKITLSIAVMSVLLIARHHSNIRKLLAGTEPRIGKK